MLKTSTTLPSRAAGQIKIDLGLEMKRAWMQWCADRGLVPNKALRALVEQALSEGAEPSAIRIPKAVCVTVTQHPDRGPKVGREVQFTPSEDAAIEAAAQAQGFGFQEWVIAAVRAALTKSPSYGQAEIEALTQSNAHMAQIAVDLAALRRQEGETDIAEALARVEGDVRQHVEKVSAAMAQGARRWQLRV